MNASGTAFFDNPEENCPINIGDLATELILEEKQKLGKGNLEYGLFQWRKKRQNQ
ncbi:MAG: hypothetical protein IPH28_25195 [Cytophagaceae bacterium]|nr:hypothetical protein [Cytophagaceae bacterium]